MLRGRQRPPFLSLGLTVCAALMLGQGATAERYREQHSRALEVMNKSAAASYTETQIEPVTMAILGGVAALGSVGAIGKTVHGLIGNKNAILEAKKIIGKIGDVSTAGCSMLSKVGDILVQEVADLSKLPSDPSLPSACSDSGTFKGYAELLKVELEHEARYLDRINREKFSVVYIQGFGETLSKVCDIDNNAMQLRQKERVVNQLWRMDGLMQGICGQRMPALEKMNSLLQSDGKVATSTGELFTALGLAFTVLAFADMAVDISDSVLNYMWGSSTKMLSTFVERQLEQMTGSLCNQSRALWEQSALTIHAGRAVKRANFEMGLFQKAGVERFSMVPDLLHDAHFEHRYGLEKESFWLCQGRCLQKFDKKFASSSVRDSEGYAHPDGCIQNEMARVCLQRKESDLAVPRSCFGTMSVSGKLGFVKKSLLNIEQAQGIFYVLQFYPSSVDHHTFEKQPELSECRAPLDELEKLKHDLDIDLAKTRQALELDSYC